MAVRLILILWLFNAIRKGSNFNITVNTETGNHLLCPQKIIWTCVGQTDDSVIRWYLKDKNGLNRTELHQEIPDGLSLTIGNTREFKVKGQNHNIGNLTANPKQLYDLEYTNLECGSLTDRANYTIQGIDIESPLMPTISAVDLFYSGRSSLLTKLTIKVLRKVYIKESCHYKKNACFKANISSNGWLLKNTSSCLSSSDCSPRVCILNFNFNDTIKHNFLTVTITAADIFNHSKPITYIAPSVQTAFWLELSNRSCDQVASCRAFPGITATRGNCNLTTYSSSSLHKSSSVLAPINTRVTLASPNKEVNTTVEAVIVRERETIHLRRDLPVRSRPWKCVISSAALGGIVTAVAIFLCSALGVFSLCLYKRKKRVAIQNNHNRDPPFLMLQDVTEPNDYSKLQVQHNYESHQGEGAAIYSSLKRDTRTFNKLHHNGKPHRTQ